MHFLLHDHETDGNQGQDIQERAQVEKPGECPALVVGVADPGDFFGPPHQHVRGGQIVDPQKSRQAEVNAFLQRIVKPKKIGICMSSGKQLPSGMNIVLAIKLHRRLGLRLAIRADISP